MPSLASRPRGVPFFALKLGLSLLAVAMIYRQGTFGTAWRQVSTIDTGFVLLAIALGLVQVSLGALRWRNILACLGVRLAMRDVLQLFYISVFFNTYVWGGVSGDVLRGWLTYRTGITPSDAVHSVILDRIAAVAGVALLMLATLPWLALHVAYDAMLVVLLAVGAGILVSIGLISQFDRLPPGWRRWRAVRLLSDLGGTTRRALFSIAAFPVLVAAILSQTALAAVTYALALALGINIGLFDCLALMQPVALIIAMPISLGGWGVREAGMIGLFGLVNIGAPEALLLAVSLGLVAQLVTLPGGVVWLLWRGGSSRLDASRR